VRIFIFSVLGLLASSVVSGAVTFDSSFESGNGSGFNEVSSGLYEFQIEADSNSTDRQWYYFEVNGATGQNLTFRITNIASTNITSHWTDARPVYSTDGGTTWQRTPGSVSNTSSTYTFTHNFANDSVRFAMHYPYTYTMVTAKIAEWVADPLVDSEVLGQSIQGRDLTHLTITEPGYTVGDGRLGIWVTCRQHAAEVTSNYTLEGFMEFLLSDDDQARALRHNAVVHVVPMVNPDGVMLGNYRDSSMGLDLNREWDGRSTMSTSPEIYLVQESIADWVSGGNDYSFYGDLHSTSGSSSSHYAFYSDSSVQPPLYPTPSTYYSDTVEFMTKVAAHAGHFNRFTGSTPTVNQRMSDDRQKMQYGVLAYTFEGVYCKVNYGPRASQWITRDDHRLTGDALGRSFVEYYEFEIPALAIDNWQLYK
jgi:Zinc carboxypeptidase/Cytosolic carboxypeptidase N-terminal domain